MERPQIENFYLMPESDRRGITDSLLLPSGVEVLSAKIGRLDVSVYTQGNVTIVWKEETYHDRQDFPEDLVEVIRTHRLGSHPDVAVNENNWYELVIRDYATEEVIHSDALDLDDISDLTEDDAKAIILDAYDIVES